MSDELIQRLRNPPFGTETSERNIMTSAADALTAAQEENERLREALRFYADISKYPAPLTGGLGELYYDCGQIARSALDGPPK